MSYLQNVLALTALATGVDPHWIHIYTQEGMDLSSAALYLEAAYNSYGVRLGDVAYVAHSLGLCMFKTGDVVRYGFSKGREFIRVCQAKDLCRELACHRR